MAASVSAPPHLYGFHASLRGIGEELKERWLVVPRPEPSSLTRSFRLDVCFVSSMHENVLLGTAPSLFIALLATVRLM